MDNPLFFRKNYLNCTKTEVAYQMFTHLGEETNFLFYNTYEPTDRILQEILLPRENYWEYKTTCFNREDLHTIGVEIIEEKITSSLDMEYFICKSLDHNKVIFISVPPKYISGLERMDPDDNHTIMIDDYSKASRTYRLNDVVNFVSKPFDMDYILDVLNKMQHPISALDFSQVVITDQVKKQFLMKSMKLIEGYNVDGLLFEKCIEMTNTLKDSPLETTIGIIDNLRQVFYILAGSRYNYSKYLQFNNYPSYLYDLLAHCSDLAEMIKNLLTKFEQKILLQKQIVGFEVISDRISLLKEFEQTASKLIQKELLQIHNESFHRLIHKNPEAPQNLRLVEITSSTLKIEWHANPTSRLVTSYVVTVNDKTYMTKGTKLHISELESNAQYSIKVQSKDFLGNLSGSSTLDVRTKPIQHHTDIALYSLVTASSIEDVNYDQDFNPYHVVDGDPNTRWSSKFGEPQWICIDLGVECDIRRIVINWEDAYAVHYEIDLSNDCLDWATIFANYSGNGGLESINCNGSGRYVRIRMLKRKTLWGFSIWNINIFENVCS